MTIIFYFLSWTLLLYWIHRIAHKIDFLKKYHFDHHNFILKKLRNNQIPTQWHWSNLFLYNDTIKSTIDLWFTEVIPTILFSLITGQWWIFIFYYLWAALVQEIIEHNPKINYPILTSGKWHLMHHTTGNKNYGLFFPLWDFIFNTNLKNQPDKS
jgi:sterol desaturase/sphingolipid hydroxylase (fatty acid hydroxylase superfamily)